MTSSPFSTPVTDRGTVGALLASVVDYAGLFPPAGLGMAEAADRFVRYQMDPASWMLGSFVVPLSRLNEFGDVLDDLLVGERTQMRLPVSVILPSVNAHVTEELHILRERHRRQVVVGSLEVHPMKAAAIRASRPLISGDLDVFFEAPVIEHAEGDGLREILEAIAEVGAKTKLRTGGVEPSMIPSAEQVASAIEGCARLGVPFKATAGLHHPIRSEHPLTYQADSPRATMHGFLNVLVASTLAFGGMASETEIAQILGESDPRAFSFADGDIAWQDRSFGQEQAARCRRSFFHSFGSCSFEEPVHDLRELEIL